MHLGEAALKAYLYLINKDCDKKAIIFLNVEPILIFVYS